MSTGRPETRTWSGPSTPTCVADIRRLNTLRPATARARAGWPRECGVSRTAHACGMERVTAAVREELAEEAARYLSTVELFRREGYEPHWRSEPPPGDTPREARPEQRPSLT